MNGSNKTRLLVAEDDGLIRLDLVDMLVDAGFEVIEAGNADEAWRVIEKTQVAALVTDIDMPGSMDGLELARRVCDNWPQCRIVVISGRYSPDPAKLPQDARFMTKPVGETELIRTLAALGIMA